MWRGVSGVALCIVVIVSLVAGCSSSQPPSGFGRMSGAGSTSQVPLGTNWDGVDWKRIASQGVDCRTKAPYTNRIILMNVQRYDITQDGLPDYFVTVACWTGDGSAGDQVEVFDGASQPSAPTLIAVLLSQGDVHLRSMTFNPATVTMVGGVVAPADSFSCPTIKVRETVTWNGSVLIENRRTETHTNSCQ